MLQLASRAERNCCMKADMQGRKMMLAGPLASSAQLQNMLVCMLLTLHLSVVPHYLISPLPLQIMTSLVT
jgi:hypothetical protein